MPLALATVAIVILRQRDVMYERSRVLTVHAAEAGIDSAAAVLRGATMVDPDGHTVGDPSRLPCAQTVPLSGAVAAAVPNLSYTVVIRYYVEDPAGHDEQ